MIEFDLASQQPDATRPTLPVTVIGLGGAGTNILDTIALEGLSGTQLVALNTDARALQSSMLGVKLQLGQELTRGLGTGGDPELGAEAVRASEPAIREELQGQKMVFLCTGLGGGTGSGAAPIVARMAREEGAFVVVFAVMPFAFEGKRRLRQAEEALNAVRAEADALITFDNDRLGEVVLPKKGIHEAFAAADKIVSQSIRAIINLVSAPGLIRIGMDELIAAVGRGDTRCLFGHGASRGANRVSEALAAALKSPLLHKGQLRERGRSVLVHVCGGPQMTFAEVQELMRDLNDGHLHEEARILFGAGVDDSMGDQLTVTLLTSLSPEEVHPESAPATPPAKAESPPAKPAAPPAKPAATAPVAAPPTAAAPRPTPTTPVDQITEVGGATSLIQDEWESEAATATPATPAAHAAHAPEAHVTEVHAPEESVVDTPEIEASAVAPYETGTSGSIAIAADLDEENFEVAAPPAAAEFEDDQKVAVAASTDAVADDSEEQAGPPNVEEWAPSHVRQGMTARMAAEAKTNPAAPNPAAPNPAASARPFHLRDLARDRPGARPPINEPPSRQNARIQPFKSWLREEEKRDPKAIEYENVGSVSEFEPTAPTPPATDLASTLGRTPKPASRLGFLSLGRGPRDAAGPAPGRPAQETFDHTLRPIPTSRGRFEKAEPTIEDGEDLDVPTFMRRKH